LRFAWLLPLVGLVLLVPLCCSTMRVWIRCTSDVKVPFTLAQPRASIMTMVNFMAAMGDKNVFEKSVSVFVDL